MGDMADDTLDTVIQQTVDGDEYDEVVLCPYCEKQAEQVTGDVVYPHRPDLKHLLFYRCEPCNAHVGCHEDSGIPYGHLATAELRKARHDAHFIFDKLWRWPESTMSRNAAYRWLASAMKIPKEDCHIAMFDVKQCNKTEELSRKKLAKI